MSNKLINFCLALGTLNHAIFLAVIYFGFVTSGFKFHGDNIGGVMMVYALTIFFPQVFIEIGSFAILFITLLVTVLRGNLLEISRKLIISYLGTLLFSIATVIIIDFSKY